MTTNYYRTFITASSDSKAERGTVPPRAGSIASLQHVLLSEQPYAFTSDELLFEVHARRNAIAQEDREREHIAFLARSRACLRASPLVKQFGWGLHHDHAGKVAAYGVETELYHAIASKPDVRCVAGMRNRRG